MSSFDVMINIKSVKIKNYEIEVNAYNFGLYSRTFKEMNASSMSSKRLLSMGVFMVLSFGKALMIKTFPKSIKTFKGEIIKDLHKTPQKIDNS